MRIIQAWNHSPALQIDHRCVRSPLVGLRVVDADDSAIFDRNIGCFGIFRVQGGDAPIVENQVSRNIYAHTVLSFFCGWGFSQILNKRVSSGITAHVRQVTIMAETINKFSGNGSFFR